MSLCPTGKEKGKQKESSKNPDVIKSKNIKGLCLSGGGITGIGHIGALMELDVSHIEYIAASSAGAIVAGLLACKIPLPDLKQIIFKINFQDLVENGWTMPMRDVWRLYQQYGLHQGDILEKWYGEILISKGIRADITLGEIKRRYRINLIITTLDLTIGTTIYVNPWTYPDLPLVTAIRRSASIPFYFIPSSESIPTEIMTDEVTKWMSVLHYYVDGGTLDNYPIQQLYNYLNSEEIVGLKLCSKQEMENIEHPDMAEYPTPPQNIMKFALRLIFILRNAALKQHVPSEHWSRTIAIDTGSISATEFNLTDEQKIYLLLRGKKAVDQFLIKYQTISTNNEISKNQTDKSNPTQNDETFLGESKVEFL